MNTLKYIAIVAMVIDHVCWSFMSNFSAVGVAMHFIGRTTAPIMFYAAAEGYNHTRNIRKYLARLGIFALISIIPFNIYNYSVQPEAGFVLHQSVIFTIFMGVLAIHVRRSDLIKNEVLRWAAIFALALCCIPADWGYVGFLMIFVFDYFYGDFKQQAIAYSVVILLAYRMFEAFESPIDSILYDIEINYDSYEYIVKRTLMYAGAFVPLLLLSFYKGERGNRSSFSKWFFYIFYPAHLLVLAVIKLYLV